MERITQRQLRNDNAEIMRRVEAGESFVVTRHGQPVAELAPYTSGLPARPRFVEADVLVAAFADLPPWDVESWQREQAELDEVFDDEWRDPWQQR